MANISQSPNHREAITAISSITGKDEYLYSTNHQLDVNATVTAQIGTIVSTNAQCYTGQVVVDVIQVQINASSHSLDNGMVIKSLSTNADNIYVGLTGVTTSSGDILEPGESRGYAINNTNLLYIIGANNTDKISYEAN